MKYKFIQSPECWFIHIKYVSTDATSVRFFLNYTSFLMSYMLFQGQRDQRCRQKLSLLYVLILCCHCICLNGRPPGEELRNMLSFHYLRTQNRTTKTPKLSLLNVLILWFVHNWKQWYRERARHVQTTSSGGTRVWHDRSVTANEVKQCGTNQRLTCGLSCCQRWVSYSWYLSCALRWQESVMTISLVSRNNHSNDGDCEIHSEHVVEHEAENHHQVEYLSACQLIWNTNFNKLEIGT